MKVHAIGDSHVRLLRQLTDADRVHWLGPMTMHRVARDGVAGLRAAREWLHPGGALSTRDWMATILPGALVVWVCGEIDVRCHLAPRCLDAGGWMGTPMVQDFMRVVDAFAACTGTTQAVLSLTPAMDTRNPEFPCRGPLDLRRSITCSMNRDLQAACASRGMYYLDLFAAVSDRLLGMRPDMAADAVHLGRGAAGALAPLLNAALLDTAIGGFDVA